jgi:signal transduction histidine kinase
MRFPPPVRFTAPLTALAFGLVATWLDYRLNLDLDLARHLADVRAHADAHGQQLARVSERLLAAGEVALLQEDLTATTEFPGLALAMIIDENGDILADATGTMRGRPIKETPLGSIAAALAGLASKPAAQHSEDALSVVSAHPFKIGEDHIGWVFLKFDRFAALAAARADALAQLRWMASAMALLTFILWAVLHFGFAARLARLAESVRAFGENRTNAASLPRGADEVGELATAFSDMATNLREREREQLRLEREVLEISESEQRRIGRDLHDGIGQRLTAASMAANAAVATLQKDAPAHAARVEEIGRQLREVIVETRALCHGLVPVALAEDGLANALRSLAENTTRSAVRCVFEQYRPVRVTDEFVAGHLYRITQEAVNNALKHASPTEIRIALEADDPFLLLEVDDDGDGVNVDTLARSGDGGIGLQVMRYRAQLIGGTLEIVPAPAGGLRVSCRVKWPR